jgi:exosome complex component RRP43
MGKTTVVCGVKAEIAEPDLDKPNAGFLGEYITSWRIKRAIMLQRNPVPNLDLPALCSPKYKPGPPSEDAQVLSEKLNEILSTYVRCPCPQLSRLPLYSSNLIPLESLCIQSSKSAWVLYVDAICINYDGNALDAALLAMVAALRNTKLPSARWDEEQGKTLCRKSDMKSLSLNDKSVVSMSFGVFDQLRRFELFSSIITHDNLRQHIFVDPSSFEEPLLDTNICVALDNSGNVVSLTQAGLGLEDGTVLAKCTQLAKERSKTILEAFPPL